LRYADRLTRPLHANPTFGRLLKNVFTSNPIRAFSLLNAVYMVMSSAGQFRLFGSGSSPNIAIASILRIAKGGKELSKDEKEALQKMIPLNGA
jgi:dimethylaniline monooxygenase (N-oxide forming)